MCAIFLMIFNFGGPKGKFGHVDARAMVAPVRLFMGGLPATVRDDEVRARFAPFGDVRNIEVIRDTAFGGEQCRGFAYVELTAAEAEAGALLQGVPRRAMARPGALRRARASNAP